MKTSNVNIPLWPTDDDLDELDSLFDEITQELELTVPDIPWQDAYEANKTRKTCILCGKNTIKRDLLGQVINNCRCVDKLAEQQKNKRG